MNKKAIIGMAAMIGIIGASSIVALANNSEVKENEIMKASESITENEELTNWEVNETDFRVGILKRSGILIGDERGDLQLEETLKRQEMVVLISRLMGKEEEAKKWDTSKITFMDVAKDDWAAPYIAWAKENNITKGYSEEWFGYDEGLTEEQTGIFLLRVLGYEEAEVENVTEIATEIGLIGYYDKLEDKEIKRGKVGIMIYNALYTTMKETEEMLKERLDIETGITDEENKIAQRLIEYGIEYKKMTESNGWKIIYVDLKGKEINAKTVEEEIELYYMIGNEVEYSHYVLIDINTNEKVEVINYTEFGVIYQIKVEDKVIYEYTEE